ncbi:hypothetical protein CDAR_485561 [Caerostris darwini]|uniref:Uncharacterized protein n=1 Tax=Caerostris darwini TaxID=1538125 RepID=A0AAV4QV66_9ARAC|nr:hypothetical protein CDAR_485561 [Caerostris darwini]
MEARFEWMGVTPNENECLQNMFRDAVVDPFDSGLENEGSLICPLTSPVSCWSWISETCTICGRDFQSMFQSYCRHFSSPPFIMEARFEWMGVTPNENECLQNMFRDAVVDPFDSGLENEGSLICPLTSPVSCWSWISETFTI